MNITVNIECSPDEARRLMGLPDLAPIHDLYLDKLKEAVAGGLTPESFEKMIQLWAPMGEAGFGAWRQLMSQLTGTAKS